VGGFRVMSALACLVFLGLYFVWPHALPGLRSTLGKTHQGWTFENLLLFARVVSLVGAVGSGCFFLATLVAPGLFW